MASVTFDKATRLYPGSTRPAVDALDLSVADGEFLVLVGPSGCGKSTSLRMLAGLEEVNDGSILIGDRNVTDVPPKDRDIAMVFQNYALQGGLILGSLAVIAVVVLIISNSIRPPGPGPRNMLSDGITVGANLEAVKTAALVSGKKPVVTKPAAGSKAIVIQLYVDYMCPVCGAFEKANSAQITTLVKQGAATIEIHPVAILDNSSVGARYSTRAANAAACVADFSPNRFYDFSALLFTNQPKESTTGLSDARLTALTVEAKVTQPAKIASCISNESFKAWTSDATNRAVSNPKLLSATGQFGTPTVLVNGSKYSGSISDPTAFAQFVASVAGASFTDPGTATPAPTPAPSPATE